MKKMGPVKKFNLKTPFLNLKKMFILLPGLAQASRAPKFGINSCCNPSFPQKSFFSKIPSLMFWPVFIKAAIQEARFLPLLAETSNVVLNGFGVSLFSLMVIYFLNWFSSSKGALTRSYVNEILLDSLFWWFISVHLFVGFLSHLNYAFRLLKVLH